MLHSWSENWRMIRELWADWTPNEVQAAEWMKALKNLNQDWLNEAISNAYSASNWKEPRLKQVIAAFHAVKRQYSAQPSATVQGDDPRERRNEAVEAAKANLATRKVLDGLAGLSDDDRARLRERVRWIAGGHQDAVIREALVRAAERDELENSILRPELISAYRELFGISGKASELDEEVSRILGDHAKKRLDEQINQVIGSAA